eukprot:9489318-Pyramimonas_sp.AAC.1
MSDIIDMTDTLAHRMSRDRTPDGGGDQPHVRSSPLREPHNLGCVESPSTSKVRMLRVFCVGESPINIIRTCAHANKRVCPMKTCWTWLALESFNTFYFLSAVWVTRPMRYVTNLAKSRLDSEWAALITSPAHSRTLLCLSRGLLSTRNDACTGSYRLTGVEILAVSLIMPSAGVELGLNDTEKGWLSGCIFIGMLAG